METERLTRMQLVEMLIDRDGLVCQYPGHAHDLDLNGVGQQEVTIDHWICQSWARANGWTEDEIWALTNLKLMCKRHNAQKGDLLPNADGTLPKKPTRTFRYRRDKRAQRAEICEACAAGRNLGPDEWCNACGHGPQPGRFPKWRQETVKDCDHDLFYCVSCTIWFPEIRRSALDALLTGGAGYEDND